MVTRSTSWPLAASSRDIPATTAAPPPPMGGNSYEVIRIRIRPSPASRACLGTTRECCASETACGRSDAMSHAENGPWDYLRGPYLTPSVDRETKSDCPARDC